MAVPIYTGSVSVPSLGFFSSATSVPGSFSGAVTTGPNPYGFVSIGDVNASRSSTGGAVIVGGVSERSMFDYGLTTAHTTTLSGSGASATGNLAVNGTIQALRIGTLGYIPPHYIASGAATNSGLHVVFDNVLAGGSTTSITLQGAAAFTSFSTYGGFAMDVNTGAIVGISPQTGANFTFASTNGHRMQFFCIGN